MNEVSVPNSYDDNVLRQFNVAKKKMINHQGGENFKISKDVWFDDDKWDFTSCNIQNRTNDYYVFNFKKIPGEYVPYVKMTILTEKLIKKNKFRTLKGTLRELATFIKMLSDHGIKDVRLLDKEVVKKIIEQKASEGCQDTYIEKLAISLKKMLVSVEEVRKCSFIELKEYLDDLCKKCRKYKRYTAKNEYIPDDFLNQIVSLALKDIENEKLKTDERIVAALIIIMAETGMRVEEIASLETNKLRHIKVKDKKVCYLEFLTFKTQLSGQEAMETYTWLSEKALKAYNICERLVSNAIDDLREETKLRLLLYLQTKKDFRRRVNVSELRNMVSKIDKKTRLLLEKESRRYLFISAKYGKQKKGGALFRENLEKFFVRHGNDFDIGNIQPHERRNIKKFQFKSEAKYKKFFEKKDRERISYEDAKEKEYWYVNPHMFRVTVCTKLFKQGIHLDFIVKHMNHLSEEMTVYYNKSHETMDILKEGKEILLSISNEEGLVDMDNEEIKNVLIDRKGIQEKIYKINMFLKENKLNIREDLQEVLKVLTRIKSPVTENSFGVCLRTIIHGVCDRRKYFSSISDYYFIGIQLQTYKFINFSYERFKQKIQVVQHNKQIAAQDERYKIEYQREEKTLKAFVSKTLLNELKLLEEEMRKKTVEEIIEEDPMLERIILNLKSIKREVAPWIK